MGYLAHQVVIQLDNFSIKACKLKKSDNEDFSAVIIMPFGAVTDIKMSRLNLIRTTQINLFFLPDFCLGV